jgi:hypothetical protein
LRKEKNITQVLKFEDEYYELGDIISVVYETYMRKPVVGRLIEFNKQTGCGITLSETITLDTSDKYNSRQETLYISSIQDINKVTVN